MSDQDINEILKELPVKVDYFEATCICGNKIEHNSHFDYEEVEENISFGQSQVTMQRIETCNVCEAEIEFNYTCSLLIEVDETKASVIAGPKRIDGRLIDDNYYGKEIDLPDGTYKTLKGSVWIQDGIITTIFSHHDERQLTLELGV